MRSNIDDALVTNCLLKGTKRVDCVLAADSGTIVLGADTPDFVRLQLGGAVNVRLPAAAVALKGRKITILNESSGANTATIQDSAGNALPVASTITQNACKSYVCNGTLWYAHS